MDSKKCGNKRKLGICCIVTGVIMFSVAVVILIVFPYIYNFELQRNLALTNGSLLFNLWKDVPIPIYQKFYFFNITNPDGFRKGEKLIVKEVGPYVYQCGFVKEDMVWYPNKTMSFRERRSYVFDRDLSVGPEDDSVYTLNGPFIMAADYIKDLYAAERTAASVVFSFMGETLVIKKKIKELNYLGYDDSILKYGKYIRPDLPYKNKFAWLYGKNDTDDGKYNVFTGEDTLEKLNIIDLWNGNKKLTFWKNDTCNDTCNMINGTNAEVSPPLKEDQQKVSIFQSFICRSLTFSYTEEVTHLRMDGKRFVITEDVLANQTINKDNACFDTKPFLPSGVIDMGACQFDAPVLLSLPHFYLADPLYQTMTDGLKPNGSLHTTYMDVMSLVGFGMEMAIRLQINAYVHQDTAMLQINRVRTGVYPIFWMEISGKITPWLADFVYGKMNDPKSISYAIVGVLMGLAMIFITIGVVCVFILPMRDRQRKQCDDDPLINAREDVKVYSSFSENTVNKEENGKPQTNSSTWVQQDLHKPVVEGNEAPTGNSINQQDNDVHLLES